MKTLQLGSFGADVYTLQNNLEKLGYGDFIPTGYFGEKSRQAVRSFQTDQNIAVTGVYGLTEHGRMLDLLADFNRVHLFTVAESFIGVDASPADQADDNYGCADSMCGVLTKAFPRNVGFPWTVSTYTLWQSLRNSPKYIQVSNPLPGDILVSPTGTSAILNTPIKNGHTGIVGAVGTIMSNNSLKGIWESNFTMDSWKARYVDRGGYKMYFFRRK